MQLHEQAPAQPRSRRSWLRCAHTFNNPHKHHAQIAVPCIRGSAAAAAAAAAAGHSRLGRKPGPLPMPGDIAHFVASLPSPTEFDVEAGAPSPLEPAAGTRRTGSFASPVRTAYFAC